jgi:peroxiredoxin Q/BCP
VGDIAPDFELTADDGGRVRLSEMRGRRVVLFFYPRAGTPSCTVEACGFRDHRSSFDELGAVVFGISPDTVRAVARFRTRFGLNFRLLADTDHTVADAYGVWKPKQLFGHHFMGVERTTFLIDEEGRVARIFEKVRSRGHAEEVARALAGEG